MIAGYIPWRWFGVSRVRPHLTNPFDLFALCVIAAGATLLGACIWEFAQRGRGTLSPVDPPKQLVVQGLYRYVRNPMYLSVSTILLGAALLARSVALLGYWAVFFAAANLFVMLYEEPALRRQFGESYERYRQSVGRWIPRL
jgi:protein-S-isoprenylcysteine O-methyltransferase Ste14